MFSWTPYAFVRFLLFFVSGILLGIYFHEVLPENIAEVAFLLFTVAFVLLIQHSIRAQVWADEALKRNVNGVREQTIASALVLGVTDGLDNELLNAYSAKTCGVPGNRS